MGSSQVFAMQSAGQIEDKNQQLVLRVCHSSERKTRVYFGPWLYCEDPDVVTDTQFK